jgi:CheY-like chemotaxis protein
MTADHWQTKENAEFLRQLGFYHGLMRLNSGDAVLKGITISDGIIEFDVNTIGRGAPGIAFRQQDEDNFELLYLRPDPACPVFQACIQYAPQTRGVLLWDLFPQYQTRAPLRENGWNHIKMIISGRRMNVFVNDATSPTLEVGRLEGDAMTGGLRVQGPGTFANMVITPNAVGGLSPEPVKDPLDADRALVRNSIIQNRMPDLVFLDVQMPERNGLEVIAEVGPERMPLTVFVTAYDNHAIRAFEANALDYLLKPFSDERFDKTMARVSTRIDERSVRDFGQRILRMLAAEPAADLPLDRLRSL